MYLKWVIYAVPGERTLGGEELRRAASGGDSDEVAPETYNQAVKNSNWRDSMKNEIKALKTVVVGVLCRRRPEYA